MEESVFIIVRAGEEGEDHEVLARAGGIRLARDLFRAIADLYPDDEICLKNGVRIIEQSKPKKPIEETA